MIGIDTNILVRFLTQDDAGQARRVDALIANAESADERLHVDAIVLCECVWVLGRAYGFDKATLADTLDRILSTALFSFDDRDSLRVALEEYRDGAGDFADYVIGQRNAVAGCRHTVTFDRALKASGGFVVL